MLSGTLLLLHGDFFVSYIQTFSSNQLSENRPVHCHILKFAHPKTNSSVPHRQYEAEEKF
jgi:hypothetical protein